MKVRKNDEGKVYYMAEALVEKVLGRKMWRFWSVTQEKIWNIENMSRCLTLCERSKEKSLLCDLRRTMSL